MKIIIKDALWENEYDAKKHIKIIIHFFFKKFIYEIVIIKWYIWITLKLYMIIKILFEKIIRIYQRDIFYRY